MQPYRISYAYSEYAQRALSSILQERIDAVEEILDEPPSAYDKLASLLKGLPDLARGLARITYGKCTPKELATLLTAYQRIGNAFEPLEDPSHAGFKSPLWNDIVSSLPRLRKPVSQLLEVINLSKARSDDKKSELWVDDEQFEELANCKFVSPVELFPLFLFPESKMYGSCLAGLTVDRK